MSHSEQQRGVVVIPIDVVRLPCRVLERHGALFRPRSRTAQDLRASLADNVLEWREAEWRALARRLHTGPTVRVLSALDFGESSLEALRQARALAHGIGGSLAVCHVLPGSPDLAAYLGAIDPARSVEQTAEEEQARRELTSHVREKVGLEVTEAFVERGAAYAEIARRAEAWGANFIVVGTHGRQGLARAVLGSVAERVVRHAHCSVLVARPTEKTGIVLVATDLSPTSLPAIAEGAAAAKRTLARLVIVSVLDWGAPAWTSTALFGALPAVPTRELKKRVRDTLKGTLDDAVARAGVAGEARVLEGPAASEIVHHASELGAELVVVGTHGRTGLPRLALGSVAERVIRSASCSVLAVRVH
jgi:nucleotide-binding universal stress UspA family protein